MKSSKSKGKNNARTRRGLKPTSGGGPGLAGALGPCVKVGKKNRGGSEGLLENSHAGKGAGKGKKNAVGLRGG